MSLPYFMRLLCLSLATFFLVHFMVGLIVSLAAPSAIQFADWMAEQKKTRLAARLMFALRLLPLGLSLLVVMGLCVPSYLRFEPEVAGEHVGWVCAVASLLALFVWGISLARVLRATVSSSLYVRRCRRRGYETRLGEQHTPTWVIKEASPFLALAGIVRPRLVISEAVVNALPPDQMTAALRHERAHQASRDNFKRMLVLLAPNSFPWAHTFESIERAWARLTEWAADDRAVDGDSRRSISLAAALVRVARLSATAPPPPLVHSLVSDGENLAARVDRLLRATPRRERPRRSASWLIASSSLIVAAFLAVLTLGSAALPSVHRLLECLIR